MKLLELIVKNVKRKDIPEDAKFFVQGTAFGTIVFIRGDIKPTFINGNWLIDSCGHCSAFIGRTPIASDASTTIITREELMRAYDAAEISGSNDEVNHPPHYTSGNIECIDIIREMVRGKSEMEAACIANIVKYLYRYKDKGGIKSIEKAQWYLNLMIEEMRNEK